MLETLGIDIETAWLGFDTETTRSGLATETTWLGLDTEFHFHTGQEQSSPGAQVPKFYLRKGHFTFGIHHFVIS